MVIKLSNVLKCKYDLKVVKSFSFIPMEIFKNLNKLSFQEESLEKPTFKYVNRKQESACGPAEIKIRQKLFV